ncbi:hypothetical protein TH61_04505 [Rufibacter sp. DG15C]|uniref:OmpP1/FadL family transporter n=1 Tax=Rufibacter sp. DG15C TaxID=1379909 RepID=UPI00078EC045|nr:hypothetical protein [Rufibacter sp. DG15C]AMM50587.1 hypothetical protein TH61_04505 [Rufibacter sp. DG15C]
MKKYSILLACLALLGSAGEGFAQNEADVLRYSRTDFGGTARTLGLSGASVALGGDAGTFLSNPAGLGLFRRSEVTVSAGLNFNEANSTVYGTSAVDSRNNLNVPQLAIVISRRKADDEEGDWRSGSFGVGYTRLNNFNQRTVYAGTSPATALKFGEYAAQLANRNGLSPNGNPVTLQDLAFDTYLIDEDDAGFFSPNLNNENPFSETIQTSGSQNQFDLSYGASFRDKLFLGASVGITSIRYKRVRTYSEQDPATDITDLTLRDELLTEGSGVMLKAGAIYRPNDAVRFGVSVQTPTWYTLRDSYNTSLEVNFRNEPSAGVGVNQFAYTDPGEFEYNLTTPFRASAGTAVFIGKNGFITADVEYVDYSNGRLSADDYSYRDENATTKSVYNSALNYRIGAEGRFDVFRVRAGYGLYGDPFDDEDVDQSKTFLTGGVGIKQNNYFLDAALVYSKYKSLYSPFTNAEINDANSEYYNLTTPLVTTDNKNTSFVVTFGWNF